MCVCGGMGGWLRYNRFPLMSSRQEPLHASVLMPGLECRSSLISHPILPPPTLSREYSGGSTLGNPGDK